MKRRYKKYLDIDDDAITKRTATRFDILRDHEDFEENVASNQTAQEDNRMDACNIETQDEINNDLFYEANSYFNVDDDIQNNFDDLNKIIDDVNIGEEDNVYNTPTSLEDFLQSEAFSQAITTNVDKTVGELFLMVLKFSLTNGLSATAITNLFKLVNTIFETPVLPHSRYIHDKLLNPKICTQFHAVCQYCSAYLGQFGEMEPQNKCNNCEAEIDVKNPSNESFFVLIDPSKQISDLLKTYEEHYEFVTKERVSRDDCIEDVYDGKLYRTFLTSLSNEDRLNYVTVALNTDGAPKFKSSQRSIWPLYLMIHQLPKQDRMKHLICCGLWFNKNKPDMSIYLDKFVDLMNDLKENGIFCTIKSEQRLVKPFVLSCCVDSVARAPIQGLKQFNGHYGCNWCLDPGEYDGRILYTLTDNEIELRNHKETVDIMLQVEDANPILGVKYPSPLINSSSFDIVEGFTPDYMHCCLEGVASQMLAYYLEPLSADEIKALDDKIMKISAPHQVARLSRCISSKDDWKARVGKFCTILQYTDFIFISE